jgi:hypothetical protein
VKTDDWYFGINCEELKRLKAEIAEAVKRTKDKES